MEFIASNPLRGSRFRQLISTKLIAHRSGYPTIEYKADGSELWSIKGTGLTWECKVRDRAENTQCAYARYPCQKWLNKSSSSSFYLFTFGYS